VLKSYRSGATVRLGEGISSTQEGLNVGDRTVELNTIQPLLLNDRGDVAIRRIGASEPWLIVPASKVDDTGVMLGAVNQLVKAVP
jgi:hypothetical protein